MEQQEDQDRELLNLGSGKKNDAAGEEEEGLTPVPEEVVSSN